MKSLKDKKYYKVIKVALETLIFIVLVGFVLSVCLQRFSNNKLSIFNYRMFTVISGSMEPKYKIGDVLIAKEIDPKTIKIGDIISYLGNTGSFKDKVVTHQVTKVEKVSSEKKSEK